MLLKFCVEVGKPERQEITLSYYYRKMDSSVYNFWCFVTYKYNFSSQITLFLPECSDRSEKSITYAYYAYHAYYAYPFFMKTKVHIFWELE